MYNKYPEETNEPNCVRYDLLNDWARNHKTIIILDGGDCQDLYDIVEFLIKNDRDLKLPFSYFKEDARSLHNALTAVAVVVPREIYDVKLDVNNRLWTNDTGYILSNSDNTVRPHYWPNRATQEFYDLLKSKGLAR